MDIFSDAEKLVRQHLTEVGVDHSAATNIDDVLFLALNRGMKRVKPVPRTVQRCKHFDDELAKLTPTMQAAVNTILEKIRKGDDISGHLSKGIDRAQKPDDLLADWNVHHIHISDTKANASNKFFDRTEEVMFVVFMPDAAYCIDVHSHDEKKHPTVWTRQLLFETIAQNWPSLVEKFRLKGVTGLSQPITDDIRKILRKNTLVPVEYGGALYFPPGGGLSTANTPMQVQVDADHMLYHFKDMEKYFRENAEKYAAALNVDQSKVDFALVADAKEHWVVIETNSKIPLARMEHPFR